MSTQDPKIISTADGSVVDKTGYGAPTVSEGPKLSSVDFAKLIRPKLSKDYDVVDDHTLSKAYIAKFPEYVGVVEFPIESGPKLNPLSTTPYQPGTSHLVTQQGSVVADPNAVPMNGQPQITDPLIRNIYEQSQQAQKDRAMAAKVAQARSVMASSPVLDQSAITPETNTVRAPHFPSVVAGAPRIEESERQMAAYNRDQQQQRQFNVGLQNQQAEQARQRAAAVNAHRRQLITQARAAMVADGHPNGARASVPEINEWVKTRTTQPSLAAVKREEEQPKRGLSIGELRQRDEPAVASSQFVRAQQAKQRGAAALKTNPTSAEARMYDPRENVAETAATEQDRVSGDIDWREKHEPAIAALTQRFRGEIQKKHGLGDPQKWINETATQIISGLSEYPAAASDRMRVVSEAARRAAEEEGADRNAASRFAQSTIAGLVSSAPEMAAMALGAPAIAAFGVGGGVRAAGTGRDVFEGAGKGAALGAAFELPVPAIANPLGKAAARAGIVGTGATGVELAAGQPLKQAMQSGLTTGALAGGFGLLHGEGKAAESSQDTAGGTTPAEVPAVPAVPAIEPAHHIETQSRTADGKVGPIDPVKLVSTGETRLPVEGEWFIDGSGIRRQAKQDYRSGEYQILGRPTVEAQNALGEGGVNPSIPSVEMKPSSELSTALANVRSPSESSVQNAASGTYSGATTTAEEIVPIDSLEGGVRFSDPAERQRVDTLKVQLQSPDGYLQRIVVDGDGNVIEGQHRLEALRELGVKDIPIVRVSAAADVLPEGVANEFRDNVKLRHEHANQLLDNAADIVKNDGVAALDEYDPPRGYEKEWDTLIDLIKRRSHDRQTQAMGQASQQIEPNRTVEGIRQTPQTVGVENASSWAAERLQPEPIQVEAAKPSADGLRQYNVNGKLFTENADQSGAKGNVILITAEDGTKGWVRANETPVGTAVPDTKPQPEGAQPKNVSPVVSETPATTITSAEVGEQSPALEPTANQDTSVEKTTGIAQRVEDLRRAESGEDQSVPGEGISAQDSIEHGRQLLKDGRNPQSVVDAFEKDKAISADGMALVRAHHEELAKAANRAFDEGGQNLNDPKFQAAEKARQDWWEQAVKPMQTEWHKTGMAQQGETGIDTGTFYGLYRAFKDTTGREMAPTEERAARSLSSRVATTDAEVKAATKTLQDALDKATARNADLKEKLKTSEASRAVEKIKRDIDREGRSAGRKAKTKTLDDEFADLVSQFRRPPTQPPTMGSEAGAVLLDAQGLALLSKMVRNRVQRNIGIKAEELIDQIHGALQDVVGLGKRDIREAIAGWGRDPKPRSELQIKLDGLKSELRKGLVNEEIAAGRRDSPELARAKSTARSRLAEVKQWVANGKRTVKGKSEVIPDAELSTLRAEISRLLPLTEALESPAVNMAAKLKAAEKAVAETQTKVDRADTSTRQGGSQSSTPAIDAVRAQNKLLNDILRDMRTSERRATKEAEIASGERSARPQGPRNTWPARRKALEAKIAEYERQVTEQDFPASKPKGKTVDPQSVLDLKAKYGSAKQLAATAALRERLNQRGEVAPEDTKAIWEHTRDYVDRGESFGSARQKTTTDLGLTADQVTRALTAKPSIKRMTDEMYRKMSARRSARSQAEAWLRNVDTPAPIKALQTLRDVMFNIKIGGGLHGTVGPVTHAGENLFHPSRYADYFTNVGRTWKALVNAGYHEELMQKLENDPNFTMWQRSGLAVDPKKAYDPTYENALMMKVLGKPDSKIRTALSAGNRGFSVLKMMRLDFANSRWSRLADSQKTPEMAERIAQLANHSTGAISGPVPGGDVGKWVARNMMFAGPLEASRWARGKDIAEAGAILGKMAARQKVSPEDAYFMKAAAKNAGEFVAAYGIALALNQGILMATGSKDRVNMTDPSKGDFLRFKVKGRAIEPTGGIISTIDFLGKLGNIAVGKEDLREGRAGRTGKALFQYGRGKLSPIASTAADVGFQADYSGRPMPFSSDKESKGKPRYSWGEYLATQQTPIPISEAVRDANDTMRQQHVPGSFMDALRSGAATKSILKGVAIGAMSGASGIRIGQEYPENPTALIKQEHAKAVKEMERLKGPGFSGDIHPPKQVKGESDEAFNKRTTAETAEALAQVEKLLDQSTKLGAYYRSLKTREERQAEIQAAVNDGREAARKQLGFVAPEKTKTPDVTP